jgi:hypothetical protein
MDSMGHSPARSFSRLSKVVWPVLLAWSLGLSGCRTEGEKVVDRFAGELKQTVEVLAAGPVDGKPAGQVAIELLRSHYSELRQLATKLEDVVRTLNESQKAELARYAVQRLAEVEGR